MAEYIDFIVDEESGAPSGHEYYHYSFTDLTARSTIERICTSINDTVTEMPQKMINSAVLALIMMLFYGWLVYSLVYEARISRDNVYRWLIYPG